jgi:hypothetical protein
LREALFSPPEPPFAIYLTRGGKKQGWIGLMHCVTYSKDLLWIGTDWLDRPVSLERSYIESRLPLAVELRERRVPKSVLAQGSLSPKIYQRAVTEGWVDKLDKALTLACDPRWEVILHVCP